MFDTYIIESLKSGKWYYGYTSDLNKRLLNHNKGLTRSTQGGVPWKITFVRSFKTKKEAVDFELYLKKSRNKDFIKLQFAEYFQKM